MELAAERVTPGEKSTLKWLDIMRPDLKEVSAQAGDARDREKWRGKTAVADEMLRRRGIARKLQEIPYSDVRQTLG